ncbi:MULTISPECIES: MarR family winged helix-turn-helix transcriptional regulator [Bacillus]|uniref:MarR family winged helix-turn-helix transcriptional regulator n=1 Tax=Bacillus TaxID=1386 RepID=UPI0013D7139F|nr:MULTISPECIES: MarR family transcriptional regulator [Bacillus]MCE7037864.1 MarR family transcriptional regulator [Bacillus cereus]MDX9636781.1 MarR family transcriptional regulator [Bacillus sp. PBL-C9]
MKDTIQVWMTLDKLHATVNQRLEKHLKSHYNLTTSEFTVITVLYEESKNGCAIQQLSEAVNLSHSAVSRLVARLETCHTVERLSTDADRRSTLVKLTNQGRRDYEETLPGIRTIINQIFEEKKEQLHDLCSK